MIKKHIHIFPGSRLPVVSDSTCLSGHLVQHHHLPTPGFRVNPKNTSCDYSVEIGNLLPPKKTHTISSHRNCLGSAIGGHVGLFFGAFNEVKGSSLSTTNLTETRLINGGDPNPSTWMILQARHRLNPRILNVNWHPRTLWKRIFGETMRNLNPMYSVCNAMKITH